MTDDDPGWKALPDDIVREAKARGMTPDEVTRGTFALGARVQMARLEAEIAALFRKPGLLRLPLSLVRLVRAWWRKR